VLQIGLVTTLDRPLGTYLVVGVYDVHISYYPGSGGAEVWFEVTVPGRPPWKCRSVRILVSAGLTVAGLVFAGDGTVPG